MTEFTVHVQIGVTPELASLLKAILHTTTTAAVAQIAAPAPERRENRQAEKPAESEKPEDTREAEAAPEAEAPTEAAPAAPEADAGEKQYTEVDVRAAMDETRRRIEGEDYKTNTESDGRKKWHRALTSWFKGTATFLGAEKPSELPDSAMRKAFIEQCRNVEIDASGNLSEPLPF